jgi:hypothetical protein
MNRELFQSDTEYQEYLEFKADKDKKTAEEQKKNDREAYKNLVDEQIDTAFPVLLEVSKTLTAEKSKVMENFREALKIKADLFKVKEEQRSNTFTHTEGTRRIMLGKYFTDAYRDTAEDGVAIIKEVIQSLAKDDESKALVNAILKLLSRDKEGNLKASRVLQLRQMANELNNERFAEGVNLIEEAYQPAESKQFIRAEYKNDAGVWINVPLGMTEA